MAKAAHAVSPILFKTPGGGSSSGKQQSGSSTKGMQRGTDHKMVGDGTISPRKHAHARAVLPMRRGRHTLAVKLPPLSMKARKGSVSEKK